MSFLCCLCQYTLFRRTRGRGAVGEQVAQLGQDQREGGKKKERRRKSGRPSSMSLSEEGSSVSCIAVGAGNRSTFFAGVCSRRKSE